MAEKRTSPGEVVEGARASLETLMGLRWTGNVNREVGQKDAPPSKETRKHLVKDKWEKAGGLLSLLGEHWSLGAQQKRNNSLLLSGGGFRVRG